MNRITLSTQAPIAAATAALALAVGMFGYSTLHAPQARPATPSVLTPAERGAADRTPAVETPRERAFTDCPSGLVYPAVAC